MEETKIYSFVSKVLENMPKAWMNLTTHRLDIYDEKRAKFHFLEELENLIDVNKSVLEELPTAFDYIRLGHPLSCLLEWTISKLRNLNVDQIISFSSQSMPLLAILRRNLLIDKKTRIIFKSELPDHLDLDIIRNIYGYKFETLKINDISETPEFDGSTVLIDTLEESFRTKLDEKIDFLIGINPEQGSIIFVNGKNNDSIISEIQHVRRRESIAMTPQNCYVVLKNYVNNDQSREVHSGSNEDRSLILESILESIKKITNTSHSASIGSCGLSVQYAIMMGLIHHSKNELKDKSIKFIVPTNCYGGTNDQARRVAACVDNVDIVDLHVDGDKDMVQSIDKVLDQVASEDAVPFIIAEIPTNPRVEVPDLDKLREALNKKRITENGEVATAPVFILDQTFCPNIKFLGKGDPLESVSTISYVSGSKFPSGGLCTAGYCVANKKAEHLMSFIDQHLKICDNIATDLQLKILSEQMPSMNKRIEGAYKNTRELVNHISSVLPEAKINFVSEELAKNGFTPSVFSLDLPTKGSSVEEREAYKRNLNLKLINLMITEIPEESKHCVSYGQLKGCYWTIPATSTQGTTKEGDKDYIVRVAVSPELNVKLHKKVFSDFYKKYIEANK
jgi:cystathionine beta-lyase/cystathionine gamma-synthase